MTPRQIAVIGAGVAGLTAAYLLQRRYDVTLFESDDRLGGHAHTRDLADAHGTTAAVDSGFLVHNDRSYPSLLRLFRELGVLTRDTEMSMSIRCEGCGLEYAGAKGAAGLFARPDNLARPRYLRMLAEIPRFHRHARRVLAATKEDTRADGTTLSVFLEEGRYTRYFVQHFILPLVSAVWSVDAALARRYPARYLFEFLHHHGMLGIGGSPQWKTVVGGSREYVERAVKGLASVRSSTPVRGVRRTTDGVQVRTEDDRPQHFDGMVIATHPDQALRLLTDPTDAERRVLGAFRYSVNETWLHTDTSLLPRARGARASWNYLSPACDAPQNAVFVSYDLTRLMGLDLAIRPVVTLNATDRIRESSVLERMVYQHPSHTPESVAAQRELPLLDDARTAYAGAYHGWGFHEDGCASGVRAAASLGVRW
ncbi:MULTISPECIES: NAD(P)/FAD-dependent oxidoreductase [Actinoalloteichus]|uniref:NAD/FAD-binding protein n=1 Tax=Actinoalloteichus fjordicus TaxID=1612552 RepID=A0AAC9LG54_9PSEU|nr:MULTISPECIES: FAD-dependent oxidoreductase [Actinoalloteichus]APU16269.1 putative NAD/FAD-binding protein [Actinoalloteichus fjordicus]APU22329.1 putative NAD/FAD-binding protein [Actinoalloteichus sp. GBA129-24]